MTLGGSIALMSTQVGHFRSSRFLFRWVALNSPNGRTLLHTQHCPVESRGMKGKEQVRHLRVLRAALFWDLLNSESGRFLLHSMQGQQVMARCNF
jgi:hypothetical protein